MATARSSRCFTLFCALVLGWCSPSLAQAQEFARFSLTVPGSVKPVMLHADEVSVWTEGQHQIVRLSGSVFIEHGIMNLRAQHAIVWLDQESYRRTRNQELVAFAVGDVRLAEGDRFSRADRVQVDLATRGEVRLKAQGSKIARQPRTDDPLYKVSRTLVTAPAAATPPAPAVQAVAASRPATTSDSGVEPAVATKPAAPAVFRQPEIVPVQAPAPIAPVAPAPVAPTAPPAFVPGPPADTEIPLPQPRALPPEATPPAVAAPIDSGPPRVVSIAPRAGSQFQVKSEWIKETNEQATVITGGVILMVRNVRGFGVIDMEADRLVIYTPEDSRQLLDNLRSSGGHSTRALQFYLAGNVEIRTSEADETRTLRADQVYYDVGRNTAVAVSADLELKPAGLDDPIHFKADELLQLSSTKYEAIQAEFFSSKLPSDPGVRVLMATATLDKTRIQRRSILGIPFRDPVTGGPQYTDQQLVRGKHTRIAVGGVPVFYSPYLVVDANDPLGPLQNFSFAQDRMFGTQFYLTLNLFKLLGINPMLNDNWSLNLDSLSARGFAVGTDYSYRVDGPWGIDGAQERGSLKFWGLKDDGIDILGGRPSEFTPGSYRGRILFRDIFEIPEQKFAIHTQLAFLSDKNFLEEYYKNEFDSDINQELFVYAKRADGILFGSFLFKPNVRNWVTEDERLPELTGAVVGASPWDIFTYNARGQAVYAELHPTREPTPPVLGTEIPAGGRIIGPPGDLYGQEYSGPDLRTGRFNIWQDVSLPFYVGPVKVVPYGVLDLTQYTNDLNSNAVGRVYGGGGVRASMPMSRVFPSVASDFFNVSGIHHKIIFAGNYFAAGTNVPYEQLPLLDRLFDDATDQAYRDITPRQPELNRQFGQQLATSPLYNPQLYAIRRLVDNRVDTLDAIQIVQADVNQRWQTKRGFPGMEHIVDFFTLDVSASFFPNPAADNFGQSVAFVEYDAVWNVGDRTSLVSAGWFDPFTDGVTYYTIGANFNRTDRTNIYVGYRYTDPLNSRAVTSALTYVLGPKYAVTGATTYDFGIQQALANSLVFTRVGTDLSASVGISYNALINTFNFTFEILPNAVASSGRRSGGFGLGGRDAAGGGGLLGGGR